MIEELHSWPDVIRCKYIARHADQTVWGYDSPPTEDASDPGYFHSAEDDFGIQIDEQLIDVSWVPSEPGVWQNPNAAEELADWPGWLQAGWVARDDNGGVWAYRTEPKLRGTVYRCGQPNESALCLRDGMIDNSWVPNLTGKWRRPLRTAEYQTTESNPEQVALERLAIKLILGQQDEIPWQAVSEQDVDSFIELARELCQ